LLARRSEVRAWIPSPTEPSSPKGVDVVGSIADAVRDADASDRHGVGELKGLATEEIRASMATL